MNDDRMDELLREGIRDYNEPGPTPREDMWARIQAGRSRRDGVGSAVPSRSSRRLWVWPSMGVAAAVLVTAGIVIGRRLERAASSTAQPVVQTAQRATPPDTSVAAAPSTTRVSQPTELPESVVAQIRRVAAANAERARELASANANVGSSHDGARRAPQSLVYRLVMLQHLAGTEAMITSFRATAARGETDTSIVAWSRELLGTTRMLAASPVADDPVMKRLLQDLDLVITEIVQYSAHGVDNPDELDLIEQTIDQRGVIPKLRGTIPSRAPSAGT